MMCMEGGRAAARRGGKSKQQAAEHKAAKQPQRGLGVAQLEKIRLHNQMMAAYRSGGLHPGDVVGMPLFAAPPPAVAPAASSSFPMQPPYLTTDRGIVGVPQQYYDVDAALLPYGSSPPPPSLFAHDVRDSSGQRLGQGRPLQQQQQHYWMSGGGSSSRHIADDLDLELRL